MSRNTVCPSTSSGDTRPLAEGTLIGTALETCLWRGRWTDQSCQGCTYQYSLAKGREQWKEGGIDKEQGHRPTVFPSLPFSTLHQLGSTALFLWLFSLPHSFSIQLPVFEATFPLSTMLKTLSTFQLGIPPSPSENGSPSSLRFKYKVWYCILICLNKLRPDWDWPSYRVGKQSWKDGSP